MTTRNIVVFLPVLVGVACGRTNAKRTDDGGEGARDTSKDGSSLADAGPEGSKDVGGPPDIGAERATDASGRLDATGDLGAPADLALDQDVDRAPDLVLGPDASRPRDSASGADVAEAPPAPFACSALAPLAAKGPLVPRATNSVLFTADRSAVVLQIKGTTGSAADDVVLVRLPTGDITPLASRVYSTEWLAPGESLLLRTTDGELVAASLDGATPTVLASEWSCDHTLSRDRKRLFSFPGSCSMAVHPLDVIDTATGATTHISTTASLAGGAGKGVVVSPSSTFAAFLAEQRLDSGTRGLVVHVLDRAGQDYPIASQPGASYPAFVTDDLLVFQTNVGDPARLELRGHIPGSGDESYLIATGRDYQAFLGYRFSRDGKQVLGARYEPDPSLTTTDLVAISLDGSGEHALASDLFTYWSISMMIDAFGLAGDGSHVVYPIGNAGSPRTFSLATVPLDGGGPARRLGNTLVYASSPVGDLVALPENGTNDGRLRVLDLGTQQEVCAVEGAAMSSPAFLPDGRGLIVAEYAATGSGRLLYLSVPGCTQVELVKLDSDRQPDAAVPPKAGFGVADPTSCFAIVQSNAPDNAGTSLVLLPE